VLTACALLLWVGCGGGSGGSSAAKAGERAAEALGEAKVKTAVTAMKNVTGAIEMYRMDEGKPPPTLDALVEKRHVKRNDVIDPWGQPFGYRFPGTKDPKGYDLWSNGPDMKPDTADDIPAED
jgi:general secretion pathway protein G